MTSTTFEWPSNDLQSLWWRVADAAFIPPPNLSPRAGCHYLKCLFIGDCTPLMLPVMTKIPFKIDRISSWSQMRWQSDCYPAASPIIHPQCIGRIKPILPASQAVFCLSPARDAAHLANLPHRNRPEFLFEPKILTHDRFLPLCLLIRQAGSLMRHQHFKSNNRFWSSGSQPNRSTGGARLSGSSEQAGVSVLSFKCSRIFWITTGSSMQAMTFVAPPYSRQVLR